MPHLDVSTIPEIPSIKGRKIRWNYRHSRKNQNHRSSGFGVIAQGRNFISLLSLCPIRHLRKCREIGVIIPEGGKKMDYGEIQWFVKKFRLFLHPLPAHTQTHSPKSRDKASMPGKKKSSFYSRNSHQWLLYLEIEAHASQTSRGRWRKKKILPPERH